MNLPLTSCVPPCPVEPVPQTSCFAELLGVQIFVALQVANARLKRAEVSATLKEYKKYSYLVFICFCILYAINFLALCICVLPGGTWRLDLAQTDR